MSWKKFFLPQVALDVGVFHHSNERNSDRLSGQKAEDLLSHLHNKLVEVSERGQLIGNLARQRGTANQLVRVAQPLPKSSPCKVAEQKKVGLGKGSANVNTAK